MDNFVKKSESDAWLKDFDIPENRDAWNLLNQYTMAVHTIGGGFELEDKHYNGRLLRIIDRMGMTKKLYKELLFDLCRQEEDKKKVVSLGHHQEVMAPLRKFLGVRKGRS